MQRLIVIFTVLWLVLTTNASITQKDFTGIGNIYVLQSEDWRTADPSKDKIGCLNNNGKLITAENNTSCGTFTKSAAFPRTLSTAEGNCTFNDETQERNTDSQYGQGDHAWNCNATYQTVIYDQLYTIVSQDRALVHHVLICPRTAFRMCSCVSEMLRVTTTPRRRLRVVTSCRCGSFTGVPVRWVSRLGM